MKRIVLFGFSIALASIVFCVSAAAQDKKIRLVKGKKLVLNAEVSDQQDRSYFFKAKEGQTVTIKLTGRDAVFELFAQHNFDAESFSEETRSWSGRLPRADSGEYAIRLISYHKVASYRLEIVLK